MFYMAAHAAVVVEDEVTKLSGTWGEIMHTRSPDNTRQTWSCITSAHSHVDTVSLSRPAPAPPTNYG